jgi:hypothetical protein
MTKEQIEDYIAKLPPPEQDKVTNLLQHSCCFYDHTGKHYPHSYVKENLLEIISQRDTYVVDSNSLWKEESKSYLGKAFIITPALSREQMNTKELILNKARCKQGNIFSVGLIPNSINVQIDRLDEFFHYCFDMGKLSEASRGKGDLFLNQKNAYLKHVENEKENVRFLVDSELLFSAIAPFPTCIDQTFATTRKACDLPSPNDMKYSTDRLKANIRKKVLGPRYEVKKTKSIVDDCHLTLLLEDEQIRKEFDDPKKENVFGDRDILFGAVYLGAKIMTGDNRLIKMAGYADITCCHVPQI